MAGHWRLPLRAGRPCRGPGRSRPPLAGSQAMADRPCRGPAVANHLCMQTTRMWPPLPRRQCLLLLPVTITSAEIVYRCIPDPDGEDEGGQASSSLAVSIQWISVVKLLQSNLATLA
ncbi:hypothetical protein BHE74_00058882 [Ensete ventricosum]|nr:hypothetical protein BHE74_00058882 [Ensete ventricosum]RZR83638.1 hypothetical protein BHM03_00010313 [Ensete ventricosum]